MSIMHENNDDDYIWNNNKSMMEQYNSDKNTKSSEATQIVKHVSEKQGITSEHPSLNNLSPFTWTHLKLPVLNQKAKKQPQMPQILCKDATAK